MLNMDVMFPQAVFGICSFISQADTKLQYGVLCVHNQMHVSPRNSRMECKEAMIINIKCKTNRKHTEKHAKRNIEQTQTGIAMPAYL